MPFFINEMEKDQSVHYKACLLSIYVLVRISDGFPISKIQSFDVGLTVITTNIDFQISIEVQSETLIAA